MVKVELIACYSTPGQLGPAFQLPMKYPACITPTRAKYWMGVRYLISVNWFLRRSSAASYDPEPVMWKVFRPPPIHCGISLILLPFEHPLPPGAVLACRQTFCKKSIMCEALIKKSVEQIYSQLVPSTDRWFPIKEQTKKSKVWNGYTLNHALKIGILIRSDACLHQFDVTETSMVSNWSQC